MRSTLLLRVAGVVGVAAMLGLASCSHDPESFCQGWVESTCQALTTCCENGTKFDPNECRLSLSSSCQSATQADKVETGEVKFDSGAASSCFGTISSCSDAASLTAKPTTYAVQQACANMVTGFTPVGAACTGAGQCEKEGDFSTCYGGGTTTGGNAAGVCAKVVLDQMTCSFSFSTLELHVCPDNLFCDRGAITTTPGEPPSMEEFEFTASCKPPNRRWQGLLPARAERALRHGPRLPRHHVQRPQPDGHLRRTQDGGRVLPADRRLRDRPRVPAEPDRSGRDVPVRRRPNQLLLLLLAERGGGDGAGGAPVRGRHLRAAGNRGDLPAGLLSPTSGCTAGAVEAM